MAGVLWMLLVVFCPLVLSESGDDDGSDKDVTCTSTLTLKQSNLTCSLNYEPAEEVFTRLCKTEGIKECKKATFGPGEITFQDLGVLGEYTLQIRDEIFETIKLSKIVKIPAPEMKLATYMEDTEDVFIWFEFSHDYVRKPKFELEIWGDKLEEPMSLTITYQNFSISRERLGGDGLYYTRVRAKPVEFFDGSWSEWSSNASFTMKSWLHHHLLCRSGAHHCFGDLAMENTHKRLHYTKHPTPEGNSCTNAQGNSIYHVCCCFIEIKHGTLSILILTFFFFRFQGLPFTFSPEIFSDVFIHRVDYVDEKPSGPELQDDLDEQRYSQASSSSTSLSEMDMKADEWLPRDQSNLKIRLLDEPDLLKERENGSTQSTTAPRRECKDEAYVTMSSLFNTQ
uniref:Interleukin 7 receptor n=1 Tax=Cyprinus carpio TaxID=7962 RepID=A0A8C1JHD6_CYPCA